MNILALDTSQKALSVALVVKNSIFYTEITADNDCGGRNAHEYRHSELMLELADDLCKTAGIAPRDLNLVACMKGPGSFTGLRIGYSAAKGMAVALGIPLAAVPTLDCLARPLSEWPGIVLPVIDAKQGRFFAALYRNEALLTDYMDAPPETLAAELGRLGLSPEEPLVLTGSGADLFRAAAAPFIPPERMRLDPGAGRGRARELLEIVKCTSIEEIDGFNSGPVYLRKSDAELELNSGKS